MPVGTDEAEQVERYIKQFPQEASIVVNGIKLSNAQAMAVRVLLTKAYGELQYTELLEALGEIGPLYKERCGEVLRAILLRPVE
jgi:predicted protein tyrosine phosphatase